MDQNILLTLRNKLESEHDTLISELSSIAKRDPKMKNDWDAKMPKFEPQESGSHSSLEEEADEVEEYEARLEAEHSLESRLLRVNEALERMQKGEYGLCKQCKKEISLERLRANPAAEAHVEHSGSVA